MPDRQLTQRFAFIGGGQMAEALIGGLLSAQLCTADQIRAADPAGARVEHLKKQYGIHVGGNNREAALWGQVIFLAIKPQNLAAVLAEIGPDLAGGLVVSVLAGVPIGRIAVGCPGARIIRTMPNQPAMVREGMTAMTAGPDVREEDVACIRQVFEAIGKVIPVEERLMDAVTGLSGSGPAYVFLAIEALTDGGVKMGLSREAAALLAAQTVLGAARMVLATGQHPARLKDQVTSPGGTTIAGLHQLEQGGLRATLINAVEAATKRSQELGR